MATQVVLALDASSTSVGYVVGCGGAVTAYGTVYLKGDLSSRLMQAHNATCDLMLTHQPSTVLIERPSGNINSVMPQCNTQGVIMYVCGLRGVAWEYVSAATGKKALTGKGNADKQAMVEHAALVFGFENITLDVKLGKTKSGKVKAIAANALLPDGTVAYTDHAADALGLMKAYTA